MNSNEREPGLPESEEEQNKIIAELKDIRANAYSARSMEVHEMIFAKSGELIERYGEAALGQCKLYHLLIGSTIEPEQKGFDVNGEIEAFIRTELA